MVLISILQVYNYKGGESLSNITTYLKKIKTAILGEEVRGAIHDAIDAINKDTESTTKRQDNLEAVHRQLIINAGNSNAEVVDARIDKVTGDSYSTLGDRLDDASKKITEMSEKLLENKIKLIEDVDGTDYKKGDVIDISYLISEQIKNYSRLMRNLHTKKFVNIICRGDSLTYGYDIYSSDVIEPSSDITDLGKSHVRTRANKQYPQMLEVYLREFGYDVTVTNLGYSGAWVKASFDYYYKKRTDNLEFIMLGTNDSRLSSCPYAGDVAQFTEYYEQLIVRELLFGNGLVLIQPVNTRNMKDIDIETFRTAVKLLGDKYTIPVIDGSEILNNYSYNIWSDATHLNATGYSILACGIASAIAVQDLTQPKQLSDGTILLTRPTLDSCCYVNDNAVYFNSAAGYTPDSVQEGGRLACRLNKGGELIYTFYNSIENLALLPTVYLNKNTRIKFQLNFGLPQAKVPLTTSNYEYTAWDGTLPNEFIIESDDQTYTYSKVTANRDLIHNQPLILANKGFYSLRITNISDESSDGGTANLFGIECMSIESFYNLCNRSKYHRLFTNNAGVGEVDAMIELSESMNNFDVLAFHTHFFGYETHIVDFSTGTLQYLKHINLVDDDGADLRTAYNEIRVQKVDDYNVKVTLNKSLVRDSSGNATFANAGDYLAKIRGISGIKY